MDIREESIVDSQESALSWLENNGHCSELSNVWFRKQAHDFIGYTLDSDNPYCWDYFEELDDDEWLPDNV